MIIGIALYNCDQITALQAYNVAMEFFNVASIEITGAGYYQLLNNGDHPGDHDIIETTLEDLAQQIKCGNATAFRVYKEGIKQPWEASFGYMTNEFGSFHHIDVQLPDSIGGHDLITSFFTNSARNLLAPYGITYSTTDVLDAFYYATGDNFVTVFPYENTISWQRETPGLYQGTSRYTHSLLRMVYSHNLLNSNHMSLEIGGINLSDWISAGGVNRGKLQELDNNFTLWIVDNELIDELNELLGNAGLLISWQPPKNKIKKTIP